jgi:phosphatidylglycerophosphate synthase
VVSNCDPSRFPSFLDPHMATVDQPTSRATHVLGDLAVGLVASLAAVGATWWLLSLPASYVLIGAAFYASLAALVLWTRPHQMPGPGMGAANRVTLGRAALAVPVFALSVQPGALGERGAWCVIALATSVLVLDSFDGRIARRTGTQTEFGARFDMEVDAALIMALSVLVWRSGRVGPWVLLIGLMRYGFVGASKIWPALGAELPPSLRRKIGAVVQGIVLLVALGPIIPVWMAVTVVAAGLAMLGYSFAVDVRWALAQERSPLPPA